MKQNTNFKAIFTMDWCTRLSNKGVFFFTKWACVRFISFVYFLSKYVFENMHMYDRNFFLFIGRTCFGKQVIVFVFLDISIFFLGWVCYNNSTLNLDKVLYDKFPRMHESNEFFGNMDCHAKNPRPHHNLRKSNYHCLNRSIKQNSYQ